MNKKKVKIKWRDAVSYYNLSEIPEKLSSEETKGELIKENDKFLIIKSPETKNFNSKNHKGIDKEVKNPTFLFVPKGMVTNIEEI